MTAPIPLWAWGKRSTPLPGMSVAAHSVSSMAITKLLPAPVPHEDAPGALARAIAHRHEADQAAVAEMVAVLEYADGHRVEEDRYVEEGALDPQLRGALGRGLVRRIAPNGTEVSSGWPARAA